MDAVKAAGVQIIASLQQSWLSDYLLPLHRSLWYWSPSFLLTVLAPLLLAVQGVTIGRVTVHSTLALTVIWTAVVSLRLNTLKQWALGEDRPYWWVKETSLYTQDRAPHLYQFPVTCLSSPSAPTHTLLAAGVGLVLARALVKVVRSYKFGNRRRRHAAVVAVWAAYLLLTLLAATADCFFSQHFPHQVALAANIGVLVAIAMVHSDLTQSRSLARTIFFNVLLLGTMLAIMYRREAVGSFNAFQKSAFKWCERREWLQIDPAPLMDAFVVTGVAVGTAVATETRYFKKLNKQKFSTRMVVSLALLNTFVCQTLLMLPDGAGLLTTNMYVMYVVQMVAAAMVLLSCTAVVPYFVQVASGVHAASTKQKKL